MHNSTLLIIDLVLTAILQYVNDHKSEIDTMTPEEFQVFADSLQAKRKDWLAKYAK